MKGEATEAQQFRLGCGSQQRTPSPRQSNESWSLCGKTLSALHLSINKLWFKGPHSFPEMKVLSAENFVVRLFVVRPRILLLCKMLSHSVHWALVLWRRKAYQRLRLSPMAPIWIFGALVIHHRWLHTCRRARLTLRIDLITCVTQTTAAGTCTIRTQPGRAETTHALPETELQNTKELRATASEIAAPKPDLDARAKKRRFWSTF